MEQEKINLVTKEIRMFDANYKKLTAEQNNTYNSDA